MDIGSLSAHFNAFSFLDEGAKYIYGMAIGAGGLWLGNKYRAWQARKALKDTIVEHHNVPINSLNAIWHTDNTGQACAHLEEHTLGHLDLTKLVKDNLSGVFLKYIDEAMKECTAEKPVVWEHLFNTIPEDKRTEVFRVIAHIISANVSPHLNKTLSSKIDQVEKGQAYAYTDFAPILVIGNDAGITQPKIYLIHQQHFAHDYFPHDHELLIAPSKCLAIFDPSDHGAAFEQATRPEELKTLQRHRNMIDVLHKNPWITRQFNVRRVDGIENAPVIPLTLKSPSQLEDDRTPKPEIHYPLITHSNP